MPESQLPVPPGTDALTAYSSSKPFSGPSAAAKSVPKEFLLPDGHPDYLRLILTSRVYDVIGETPLTSAVNLSSRLGAQVLLKREDLQPVFSFKVRGAYNKMAHLPEEERWKGVIACSAGNHAQGVAYSAKHLRIPATIVMPVCSPEIKHRNVSRLGGNVVLFGQDFDEAKEECKRREVRQGLTNIHPFDDPYVIAGQGTIAMELLRQCNISQLQAVFCSVGGGGLIAGVGVYIKRIAPHVKVIGVETHDANALAQSLAQKKRIMLQDVGLFADGAAVKVLGEETYRLCLECVDEVVQVSTDEICAAIKDVFLDTRSIVEPAGALALAGLKKYLASNPSSASSTSSTTGTTITTANPNDSSSHKSTQNSTTVATTATTTTTTTNPSYCAILSGANMDFDRLRFVSERARLGEGREVLLSVNIPERPGVFYSMIQTILPRSITEFAYRYSNPDRALIFMSISVTDRASEIPAIIDALAQKDMHAADISENEFAKSHARYLVGGTSGGGGGGGGGNGSSSSSTCPSPSPPLTERVYRFEFPERPGALANFLAKLRPDGFNISMFHYRNLGGDVGKILAGIQVPPASNDDDEQRGRLERFLKDLNYPFVDETENPVYLQFMC